MDILQLEIDPGANVYYEEGFRITIEDHLQFLKDHAETTSIQIESKYAFKYAGDLSGLLTLYKVPVYLHWTIMRMNGFSSYTQLSEGESELLIPGINAVERLRSIYKTKNRSIT
jgi:hypothetical protein